MRNKISFAVLAVVMALVCVAAVTPNAKPLVPFEREQTKGNVRVVLLKVERSTIFSTDGIRDPQPGKFYPVPVVGVTYMIEALGSEPVKNWIEDRSDDDLMIGNRKVRDATSMPENLNPGGCCGVFGPISNYANGPVELPKSFDKKRSSIQEIHERALPSSTGKMRLKLKLGFNDQRETFVFENIPLN